MKLPFISVIIPVRNGRHFAKACLESLLEQDYPKDRYEILVVDNGSTDGTAEAVRGCPGVTLLSKPYPVSCSTGRNEGIRHARGDLLALTDIDCIANPDWLRNLVRGWEDPRYGGFVGRVQGPANVSPIEKWMEEFYQQEANLKNPSFPFAQTNNVAYRRELIEEIGGFDEGLRWWADVEFGWRMHVKTPYQYQWNPEAVIYHRNRRTLSEVWNKFYSRGYGKAATAKRIPLLRRPPILVLAGFHFLKAVLQFVKLGLRGVTSPFVKSSREALLRTKFWFTFHVSIALGLASGWLSRSNRQIRIPRFEEAKQ